MLFHVIVVLLSNLLAWTGLLLQSHRDRVSVASVLGEV
jgi:hypothetical protein